MSKFKRCNLYWMIPLLHASSDNMFIKIDDNDYHLEIIDKLQYVLSNFKLKNQDIFTLVDSVLETIQRFDQDYFDHIQSTLKGDVIVFDESDFDKEMIINNTDPPEENRIKLFIRMWLFHGFVSILCRNSLMYVWDFLFLHSWNFDFQKIVVLAIMMLIRFWIMRAHNSRRLRNVLIQEPSRIYLKDLMKMIKHFMNGGSLTNFPQNTNYKIKTEEKPVRNPHWDTVKFRRDSLVKTVEKQKLSFTGIIQKINPKFKRRDSVSSVESEDSNKEPWKNLWIPCNKDFFKYYKNHSVECSEAFDFYIDT